MPPPFTSQLRLSRAYPAAFATSRNRYINCNSWQRSYTVAAQSFNMPPKRKRSSLRENLEVGVSEATTTKSTLRKKSTRKGKVDTNPDQNGDIVDGKLALRASPDAEEDGEALDIAKIAGKDSVLKATTNSLVPVEGQITNAKKQKKSPTKSSIAAKKGSDEIKAFVAEQAAPKATGVKEKKEADVDEWEQRVDPDGDEAGPTEDADSMKLEARRPPPVNSDYLPLPWKGRLGYACLNTYLRLSNPPVFTSRTCRIASILEHQHPLEDPSQPEHSSKNRPDKTKPASVERGQRYVEALCLANIRDLPKMLRWNDKYGIKFMRLSSEMFPFASHAEYGYKLAPFAREALAEVGKVASELGHRLSTHPGQFTQLGSPRAEVISSALRDLQYHDEMLSLLRLPEQQDRDAVMILHMGGTFGDKAATLDRFRKNYKNLSAGVKQRLVLENDDVSWSVHDLLPICEELNIPLCLDFHHHNIIFDSTQVREGTEDITTMFPRIKATWDRKNIRQKMHYSEPCPDAITGRQRRKHNPRPMTLPPCPNDMDLMIEAKDKEQAVFELMRTFKLLGWDKANAVVPYERDDDNRPVVKKTKKKKTKKQIADEVEEFGKELSEEEELEKELVPEEKIGMGGVENRVYWPGGMEEWLRPKKRVVKSQAVDDEEEIFKNPTPANFAARKAVTARNNAPLTHDIKGRLQEAETAVDVIKILEEMKSSTRDEGGKKIKTEPKAKSTPSKKLTPRKKSAKTPSLADTNNCEDDLSMLDLSDLDGDIRGVASPGKVRTKKAVSVKPNGQVFRGKRKSYAEVGEDEEDV